VPDALAWTKWFFVANIGATLAMFVAVVRAIPELRRVHIDIRGLLIAAVGFAIAVGCLAWMYNTLATVIRLVSDPDPSIDALMAATERIKQLPYYVIGKDVAYAIGLITVIRGVQRSAAANDQLALRDEAGSMSRALIIMLFADLFYQLTYGLGGSVGIFGLLGSLLVLAFWVYCHVRLTRFLFNAAYFMNEPHDFPTATVVVRAEDKPAPPAARPRPTPPAKPAAPPVEKPPVVMPPRPEPPRAASASDEPPAEGGPRFLR
jgi:hypothetical protein